jgi:hypothetical protein
MDKPNNIEEINSTLNMQTEGENTGKTNISLNLNAAEYVPKKKQQPQQQIQKDETKTNLEAEKLKLNLDAKAYEPKPQNVIQREGIQDDEEEPDFDDDEVYNKEVEVIVKDIIENEEVEDDESDEDKWFPKFKDCECCQGFIYKCNGQTCQNMLSCYCKVKAECDDYY